MDNDSSDDEEIQRFYNLDKINIGKILIVVKYFF